MKFAEVFVGVSNEQAEAHVERVKHENKKKLDQLMIDQATILEDVQKLKTILYAKFGKSINLELDEA